MGRQSKFDAMDSSVLAEVNRLVRAGHTIASIREHLASLGAPVSNGAVGRYVKNARENMARFKESQHIAGQWVSELGENPRGDVGVMLCEMLMMVAHNTLDTLAAAANGEPGKAVKPADIMFLSKALKDMEATAKQSMERREKIERLVLERQTKAAETTAREQGVSDAAWDAIRAKFLGIDEAAAT